MTDKEIFIQFALGTINLSLLHEIVQNTSNPKILMKAAYYFVKENYREDNTFKKESFRIARAFTINDMTNADLKQYIITAQAINRLSIESPFAGVESRRTLSLNCRKEQFKKLHSLLFED
ncbi:hypothetical protein LCGC14_1513840 [marine sediment metagenome]|uniref:Uncharacterized protein n=1 Tax=marine sediment metagenome TaxID=412755 RepID=A0A0F9J0P5_9ZZZZ